MLPGISATDEFNHLLLSSYQIEPEMFIEETAYGLQAKIISFFIKPDGRTILNTWILIIKALTGVCIDDYALS